MQLRSISKKHIAELGLMRELLLSQTPEPVLPWPPPRPAKGVPHV